LQVTDSPRPATAEPDFRNSGPAARYARRSGPPGFRCVSKADGRVTGFAVFGFWMLDCTRFPRPPKTQTTNRPYYGLRARQAGYTPTPRNDRHRFSRGAARKTRAVWYGSTIIGVSTSRVTRFLPTGRVTRVIPHRDFDHVLSLNRILLPFCYRHPYLNGHTGRILMPPIQV